ncbi:MAG: MFS transporter [Hyphomicrobiaceae bacterium]
MSIEIRRQPAAASRLPALVGALALAVALGALHAFSVLLEPLERQLGADRAAISLVYSLAIITLTAGVLMSGRLQARLRPDLLAVGVAAIAGSGLGIAATAASYGLVLVGYGAMFGFANGVGYSLFLRQAQRAMPGRIGLAVGLTTAAYAVGAMLFSWALTAYHGERTASAGLLWMAAGVVAAGFAGSYAFRGIEADATLGAIEPAEGRVSRKVVIVLWVVYLLGATGGLMAIAHAAGIVAALGGDGLLIALSATILALGNVVGSLAGGRIADTLAPHSSLSGTIALGAIATLALSVVTSPVVAVMLLAMAGFAYGALIALIPAVIGHLAPENARATVFGRVFTAWGLAGLAGPWGAGAIYDETGAYPMALLMASALSALGAGLALVLLAQPARA